MILPLFFAVALTGAWDGTSLCTNLKALPACHDEHVVYHITQKSPKMIHLVANKIVDGKEEWMGDIDFDVNGDHLTNEMTNRRGEKALWDFTVKDDRITGTLKLLPSGTVVRKIDVKKR